MDITQYEFEIKRHALMRAMQRGVTPDMVEATLKGGKIVRFGKNNLKHEKIQRIFCVPKIASQFLRILQGI